MPGLSEKIQPMADDALKPRVERRAKVISINRAAAKPEDKTAANETEFIKEIPETEEEIKKFSAYQALNGHLTKAEYNRIKKKAAEEDTQPSTQAQSYVNHAGLTLSREVLILYSVLRSDPDISSPLLHGDQQRLAEALRIAGETADLKTLINSYRKKNIEF